MRRIAFFITLALLAASARPAEDPGRLEPANTFAVIAGVLHWRDASLATYATEDRKDAALRDRLLALGVPKDQVLLLTDEAATTDAVRSGLTRIAGAARPGSTLIVYYAGHGTRDAEGTVRFLPFDYDGARAAETSLSMADLADTIRKGFRGARVLLSADCCSSGGLGATAEALAGAGVPSAAVASVTAEGESTSNWTFSQTLLAALGGERIADRDGDGLVELSELGSEVRDAMKYRERQRSGLALHGVDPGFVLVRVRGGAAPPPAIDGPFAYRDYVTVVEDGAERAGRVVGRREGRYVVELLDYSARRLVERPAEEVRRITFERHPAGSLVGVLWRGRAYRAKVIDTDGDFHRITYLGWPAQWDEWVLSNRITALPEETAGPVVRRDWGPEQAAGPPDTEMAGDHPTAWASATEDDADEWLRLAYVPPVEAIGVLVVETFHPGAVVRVTGFAADGSGRVLWSGADPTPRTAAKGTSLLPVTPGFPIAGLRVDVASRAAPGWNEIDAVGLLDAAGRTHWASGATASSFYGESPAPSPPVTIDAPPAVAAVLDGLRSALERAVPDTGRLKIEEIRADESGITLTGLVEKRGGLDNVILALRSLRRPQRSGGGRAPAVPDAQPRPPHRDPG